MKNHKWLACPNLSPRNGYLCSKPKNHCGACTAEGTGGGTLERWHSDETVEQMEPMPITVTDEDVKFFKLNLKSGA